MININPTNQMPINLPDGVHPDPRGCKVTLSLHDYIYGDGTRCGVVMSISTTGGDPETSAASRIIQIFVDTVLTDAATIRDIVLEQRAKRYPDVATPNQEDTDHAEKI